MKLAILVFLGGGFGSLCRYLIGIATKSISASYPLGTFMANLVGCVLIGFFFSFFQKKTGFSKDYLLFLTTGFCGGFTTFSTFSYESLTFFRNEDYFSLIAYVSLSVFLGLIGVFMGIQLGK